MLYILESEISNNKPLAFALMQVEGIGKKYSTLICKKLGFSINFKTKNLSKEQISNLISQIQIMNIKLSVDLKKFKSLLTKRLITIRSYKGIRKSQGLPIRGQRTHTNAKTARVCK